MSKCSAASLSSHKHKALLVSTHHFTASRRV